MKSDLLTWLTKLYIHYRVRVNPRAKCPGCGARKRHKIVFSSLYQKVMHQCSLCGAPWAESPVVQADLWAIKLPDGMDEMEPATTRKTSGAQREPIRAQARSSI